MFLYITAFVYNHKAYNWTLTLPLDPFPGVVSTVVLLHISNIPPESPVRTSPFPKNAKHWTNLGFSYFWKGTPQCVWSSSSCAGRHTKLKTYKTSPVQSPTFLKPFHLHLRASQLIWHQQLWDYGVGECCQIHRKDPWVHENGYLPTTGSWQHFFEMKSSINRHAHCVHKAQPLV